MRALPFSLLSLFSSLALAAPPWDKVDQKHAAELHDKSCTGCHARMYGGDGSKMYTRDGLMLSNQLELLQRVSACNAMVNAGWFPEDEGHVAGWLNEKFYHFEN